MFIRYQVGGTRRAEALEGLRPNKTGLREAARIRSERIARLRAGIDTDVQVDSFAGIAQQYLEDADLTISTRQSYRSILNIYWIPRLARRPMDGITYAELRQVERRIQWGSTKTRRNAIGALRRVFAYAIDEGLLEHNPVQFQGRRRQGDRPDPRPYTSAERDALLEALRDREMVHGYFTTAFYTGMRTGELLALRWDDYDGERFRVHQTRTRGLLKPSTKTEKARYVLVPHQLREVLREFPTRWSGEWLWIRRGGKPYASGHNLNKHLKAAHVAADVEPRGGPYPWRHTYASLALTAGAKPAFVAQQLGHSLQVLYQVYGRWVPGDDLVELEKVFGKGDR